MYISVRCKRITATAAIALAAIASAACSQMSKHSNMLVFATTTTVGVRVGQDVQQTPAFEIGYSRQEAAFVPLLANTSTVDGELEPCPATIEAAADTEERVDLDDCHFRATHNGMDKDSYSTLASFGSKSGASADGAEVAIAQYFATGIAAQHLALAGGANIVMAGGDSKEIARAAADAAEARYAEQAQPRIQAIDSAGQRIGMAVDADGDGIVDQGETEALKAALANHVAVRAGVDEFIGQPIKALTDFLEGTLTDDIVEIANQLSE